MSRTKILAAIFLILAATAFSFVSTRVVSAETSTAAALSGIVSSQEEGPMEGVVVSAKKDGSIVTISVVSNAQGQFSFPRTKLDAGHYALRIRAAGYDLDGTAAVDVTAQKAAQTNLKLVKTKDLAAQLTNSEWLMSAPGTEEQKKAMYECGSCHTYERIFRSHYTAADFKNVEHRMSLYDPGSMPTKPQMAVDGARQMPASPDFLSSINLSSTDHWQFPLKTMPRPTGESTRVIITQYDLPRQVSQPHDVVVDRNGIVWYGDFGNQFLGRLDPKTAKITEFPLPLLKEGVPIGYRVLWLDPQGNVWISMAAQSAVAKFDVKTETFQAWKVPDFPNGPKFERATMVQPEHLDVDGKVWVQLRGGRIERIDAKTGVWDPEPVDVFKYFAKDSPEVNRPHGLYDTVADSHNNVFFTDFGSESIGYMDAKTKEITYYTTPTHNSRPRRGHVDAQDRFWFGEDRAGKVGMLDPKIGKIQEWDTTIPFEDAYDVNIDKNGEAWSGGMLSDRLARVNPKTGTAVQYLMPRETNMRKIEVDNSTNPVTVWFGSTHGASIVKVEPLE